MKKDKKPKSKRDWNLYRAKLNCKVGRDALDAKVDIPEGRTPTEYALFCLLHAVEEIAAAMAGKGEG